MITTITTICMVIPLYSVCWMLIQVYHYHSNLHRTHIKHTNGLNGYITLTRSHITHTRFCIALSHDPSTTVWQQHTVSSPLQSVPQIYWRTLVLSFRIRALMQHIYSIWCIALSHVNTIYFLVVYYEILSNKVYSFIQSIVGHGPHYFTITLV